MTPILLVLAILLLAVVFLVTEWIPLEVTALLTLSVLAITGLVKPPDALAGFSNPAVVTVWTVFILSGALTRTGVAGRLGNHVLRLAGTSQARIVFVVMLTAGTLSAFLNNVAVAAMMLPVVMDIARRTSTPPSRLLMPLAYGSLLGGLTTLIGTPPNLLVSVALQEAGELPFRLFDFTPMGVAVMLAGTAFVAFLGRHWLPSRDVGKEASLSGSLDFREQYNLRERLFYLRLPPDSPLSGKSLIDCRFRLALGLQVLGIQRGGHQQMAPTGAELIFAGDILLVQGRLERRDELQGWLDLAPSRDGEALELLRDSAIAFGVADLAADSPLVGKTMPETEFRTRFGVNVLAIRRGQGEARFNLAAMPLEGGDLLLVLGSAAQMLKLPSQAEFENVKTLSSSDLEQWGGIEERLLIMPLPEASPLLGKSLQECGLGSVPGIRLVGVVHGDGKPVLADAEMKLAAGDRLLTLGSRAEWSLLQALLRLSVEKEAAPDIDRLESERIGLMEVVLSPRTTLAGKAVSEINFRERYGLSLLAMWRQGRPYRSNLFNMELRLGDALLVYGPRDKLHALGAEPDFLVLTQSAQELPRAEKATLAMSIMAAVILAVIAGVAPIYIAATMGAALMVLTRCLSMEEAYRAIEWKAVFLIAGLLPLGTALNDTGAARLVAENVVSLVGGQGPMAVAAALMILTFAATSIIPTAAVVLLMAPIVLSTAAQLGLSARSLMMVVAIAAASSFTSPVSHPANVLVMGPGGYRFLDYLKVGLPLTLVVFVVVLALLPWLWPLAG